MKVLIVCLLIFIVGYNIGNKQVMPKGNVQTSADSLINENTVFGNNAYQASNLQLDGTKQEKLSHAE